MSTTATTDCRPMLQPRELPSVRPSGRFGDVVIANVTPGGGNHVFAADRDHRIAGDRRLAVDPRIRPAVLVDCRVGSGAEQVRRSGDDLRHDRHVDHRIGRAVPVSFGIALFLTELSPRWLKRPLGTAIELLAAIPSIVYGMWGLFVFAPILAQFVQSPLQAAFGNAPLIGGLVSGPPVGIGILSAGIILAIMIIPFIAAVMRDVFEVTPALLKESAYGLGSTTWEVVWKVRIAVYQGGSRRGHHARAWPRDWRDDGRDVRDRQLQSARHLVPIRSRQFDHLCAC